MLIPLGRLSRFILSICAAALLIANLAVVAGLLLHKRHLMNLELRKAYGKLTKFEEKLTAANVRLQEAFEQEKKLKDFVQVLYECRPMSDMLGNILRKLGIFFETDRVSIYRIEKKDGKAVVHDSSEWYSDEIASQRRSLHSLDAAIIDSWKPLFAVGESVFVPDIEAIRALRPFEYALARKAGISSYVAAPLFMEGQKLYGFICADNPPPAKARNVGTLMLALAHFIASAIRRENARTELETASFTDAMTGVGNRNAYIRSLERIRNSIQNKEEQESHSAVFCDLNGLKKINDTLGHETGDKMITGLAKSICRFFRASDVYRTGGDEFVVLCVGLPENVFWERVAAMKKYLEEQRNIAAATGAEWGIGGRDVDEIIRTADQRMYEAKGASRGAQKN